MSSSSSSTQNHHQRHFPAATSAPPPTPNFTSTPDSTSTDLLSRLLHRLPPSLSTPTTTPTLLRRRSSLTTTISPPLISVTELTTTLASVFQLGYFQLTNHSIPSQLAHSAESDSLSIFNLSQQQKHQHFSGPWPVGFDDNDEDEINVTESLIFNSSCITSSSELTLSSLREFTCEMEKVGLAVVEALTCAMGLRNPAIDDPDSVYSLMWISDGSVGSGKFYPYVVGLHYQFGNKSCSLLTDSGLVSVSSQTDSILVTFGDIAQVWSNGKLKKVRGKPALTMEEGSDLSSLSMSLLVTLPLESTVSPLLPMEVIINHDNDENQDDHDEKREESMFTSFSFEDYAWRVYHERVPHKDLLDRYRT